MTHAAPLNDMRLVLQHLVRLPQIAAFPGFELQAKIITGRFYAEHVLPAAENVPWRNYSSAGSILDLREALF